jgi:hypothetical protein
MRRILIIAIVALALPASADASQADLSRYQTLAAARFPNHCTPVEIVQGVTDTPSAAWAWFGPSVCRIELEPEYWTAYSDAARCSILIHEYGHLAGLGHSDNPRDVMSHAPPIQKECKRGRLSVSASGRG